MLTTLLHGFYTSIAGCFQRMNIKRTRENLLLTWKEIGQ